MRILPTCLLALGALTLPGCDGEPATTDPNAARPMLWAWQRAEDLSYIDPARVGIALWIGSITLTGGDPEITPRYAPLTAPLQVDMLGVVRLEQPRSGMLTPATQVAAIIATLVDPWPVDEVQLDFDAARSQRDYYRELVAQLRQQLPGKAVSITALASWCFGDPWLALLDIDAAVPMLYRMGADTDAIRRKLAAAGEIPAPLCRGDIGYSLDEARLPAAGARRVFWYNPVAWDAHSYQAVIDEMHVLYPPRGEADE